MQSTAPRRSQQPAPEYATLPPGRMMNGRLARVSRALVLPAVVGHPFLHRSLGVRVQSSAWL